MSFQAFKRNRTEDLKKLQEKLQNEAKGGGQRQEDTTFWQPTVDKEGNGFAIIRFLPNPNENAATHWVKLYNHAFKHEKTGRWYIENCLSTIGKDDPVLEANNVLWNDVATEEAKAQVRNQKRKLSYISNIYVIEDPAKPENNGKVFKFKYGKKIFEKLNDLMNPQFPGDKAINPFDPYDGANMRLRIHKGEGGYRSYDKSMFDSPSQLLGGDDDKLEAVWNNLHDIDAEVAPDKFKSYDELKARYLRTIGADAKGGNRPSADQRRAEDVADEDIVIDDADAPKTVSAPEPSRSTPAPEPSRTASTAVDEDDDLAAFQAMAAQWDD